MGDWFWYLAAAVIAIATGYVLVRHFIAKKGNCCGESSGSCGHNCEGCPGCGAVSENDTDKNE